jgi:YD repeat-containing protein
VWTQADFYWFDYPFTTGSRVLRESTNWQIATDGTSMASTTKYYYDNLGHMFPTRIVTFNSKDEPVTKTINYPQDMVAAGKDPTGIYNAMAMANIISPAIEQYQTKNNTQLLYEKNDYAIFNTNVIKPKSFERQTLSNPPELRLQFLGYDNRGNPKSLVKDMGPKISYRWGYNQQYPVAEVVNATPDEFYYENFEENAAATTGAAHTGQNYYAGANYAINWPLPNARSYVISYWYLSGGVWKYMPEQPFTGSFTLSNGSGYDDIRVYPEEAQMKTYTYSPLLGITSETDTGSRTTYYKYDSAGRLMDIRDQDGNIVKTFQYNYRQP